MKRIVLFIISNISLILMILALAAFSVAGFLFSIYVGLIVLGLGLLYLSWVVSREKGGE